VDAIDLCYLSAAEALGMFRRKQLSPLELLQAQIARAEAVEPRLNAFCWTNFEAALAQARAAEERYTRGVARPLEGISVAVKEEAPIRGHSWEMGSLLLKGNLADETHPVVERLLAAGAIMHARTTTPEFSMSGTTWSRLWGVTRNPWNLAVTPGGSSGGAGAALAAGTTTLATGSDIGGSIRIPAALCGLVGFKPPYGRVPELPPYNLDVYCHEGPLARSALDGILMQNVIAGPHPIDIASLAPRLELPHEYPPLEGMRVAYSVDLGFVSVADDVRQGLLAMAETLRSLGVTVEEADLGWDARAAKTADSHLLRGVRELLGPYVAEDQRHLLSDNFRAVLERSTRPLPLSYNDELGYAAEMYRLLAERVFARYDALICPTLATTEVPADFNSAAGSLSVAGQAVDPFLGWVLTYPFNTLSRCPVISVPSGLAANGVPIGVQIVAPPYRDEVAFRVAMGYEAAAGPFFAPHGRPVL
jgi:Asp-tRNA(Asn)/Glu-tRNA(Gln) amidotransferase A subunit family amidase